MSDALNKKLNNTQTANLFDIVIKCKKAHQYPHSTPYSHLTKPHYFVDNEFQRSHSYTSLSKLMRRLATKQFAADDRATVCYAKTEVCVYVCTLRQSQSTNPQHFMRALCRRVWLALISLYSKPNHMFN